MVDMLAPISETVIAKMTAGMLTDGTITDLDQDDPVARFVAREFVRVRDELLEAFPWSFARKWVNVSVDVSPPPFGWLYSYTLPSDNVSYIPPREQGKFNYPLVPHEVVGNKIYTDYPAPLPLAYIYRVDNAALFTPLFARCVACQLAVYAAHQITGKLGFVEKCQRFLDQALQAATLANTLDSGTPESQERNEIIDIRGVGFISA